MESVFQQTYTISDIHTDCHGRVKPSTLLLFAQEAAAGHCVELGLDWQTLAKKNLFWAVIRQHVQITCLPTAGETITVETWPMPTTRSAYPRSTAAYDQEGNELFRCISLWVLMDTQTRSMILPGKSGVDVPGILRGNELEAPRSLSPVAGEQSLSRTVVPSDLDRNRHMNNARYLDWIDDLLPEDFHKAHPLREFTVCYLSEALEGQTLTLNWGLSEGEILYVDALRQRTNVPDKQDRIFSAPLVF